MKRGWFFIIKIYIICLAARLIEYFLIRTDQSVWGEAFLHKLLGILVLAVAARHVSVDLRDLGFSKRLAAKGILTGLALGFAAYVPAYLVEWCLQSASKKQPGLQLYVSSYSVSGNVGMQTGLIFFALCIAGNIINVVMEEGVFRGLFLKLAERRSSFAKAVLLSSVLFGLWHVVGPVRSLLDGDISAAGAAMSAVVLVASSTLVGVQFCLLTRLTGSLWAPMAAHFVNNLIVNILHIVTATGADEMQVMRISIAQTISFLMILMLWVFFRTKNTRIK